MQQLLEEALHGSGAANTTRKPKVQGGLTHRVNEGTNAARECTDWAAQLEAAVGEGIDIGLPDSLLTVAVQRVLELQQQAAEQAAAAKVASAARAALVATPIRTPRSSEWRVSATSPPHSRRQSRKGSIVDGPELRAAPSSLVLREGSLVQLCGLEGVCGLTYHGYYDASLGEYNGRKGRVSRDPPAWVIKAAAEPTTMSDGDAKAGARGAGPGVASTSQHLVPVLLDSRSTDKDRGHGIWVAVPPENLKVL